MADRQRIQDSELALKRAIQDANEILAQATTIVSFQRTQLILSRSKLVIEKRTLFDARDVVSVGIEDVVNAAATAGPIFGTIKIITKPTTAKTTNSIGLFWRNDAIRMKRVLQGYIIALQKKIDLDVLPAAELRTMLNELGTDDHSVK